MVVGVRSMTALAQKEMFAILLGSADPYSTPFVQAIDKDPAGPPVKLLGG